MKWKLRDHLRVYYKVIDTTKEIYVFEFELKTSNLQQQRTINKLRKHLLKTQFGTRMLTILRNMVLKLEQPFVQTSVS